MGRLRSACRLYAGSGICQKKDNEYIVFKYDYRNETWCNLPRVNQKGFAMVSSKISLFLLVEPL